MEQIDFVVPWVDDTDPVWRMKRQKYLGGKETVGNTAARYRDWDTLKYWFRGVEKFAPWVRYVFFVTDDQKPEWLNLDHPKLKWVKHTDYIPEEYLPTFNSLTIEWNLHRIPELSEHFVYFNDDVFLIDKTTPQDFFVDGLPCDSLMLDWIIPYDFFSNLMFNNANLLNHHFCFRDCVRKHWKKFIRAQSWKDFVRLLLYSGKERIPGTRCAHIQISFLKKTFETVWQNEGQTLHNTCIHKKRVRESVTDWCAKDWQILSGEYHPHKPIGKMFNTVSLSKSNEMLDYMRKRRGKVICLNDNENETDFEAHKRMVLEVLEEIFPEKSSFEI